MYTKLHFLKMTKQTRLCELWTTITLHTCSETSQARSRDFRPWINLSKATNLCILIITGLMAKITFEKCPFLQRCLVWPSWIEDFAHLVLLLPISIWQLITINTVLRKLILSSHSFYIWDFSRILTKFLCF